MIIIQNRGQAILSTDYWDSEHARHGFLCLSWNAGCARILVPDAAKVMLREMRSAREVIISRGPWTEQGGRDAIEVLWEDDTDEPFSALLVADQCDRLIPDTEQGGGFDVAVWTRGGLKQRWPGRYRRVDALPCLQPWSAH